ncbi:MAG: DapH/DapD/GlmU-related protein [Planctomycetota bacterium]
MMMKELLQTAANVLFLVLLFPVALLSGFGRCWPVFDFFAQTCALVPGIVGRYARRAYYVMTLDRCSLRSCIAFGSYFLDSQTEVGEGVYVGPNCVIGRSRIGARTLIGCNVHVFVGRRQHARDAEGRLSEGKQEMLRKINIGEDCWIGTSAVIMEDIGDRTTIGAGAVVTKEVPDDVVAVGIPARIIQSSS